MSRTLWLVILCGGAIMGIALGFRQAMGLYLTPISIEMGVGRGSFALAMGLMNLIWGVASPFAGALADRHGSGRVVALGGLTYAAGLLALTLSGDGGQLLLGGLLIGLGLSGAGFSVILGTVGRAAPPEKRTAALGIASMGGSIGQFAALPYTYAAIETVGWAVSLVVLALTALMIVPLARGVAGRPPAVPAGESQSVRQAFAEAGRNRSFILLNAGFFVCGFHLAFLGIHLPAYIADEGFAPWLAVAALTLIGLCNIFGSYGCGRLGDIYAKKSVLSWLYLARAALFLGFILIPASPASILVLSAAMGFLWLGTVPLTSGLVATIFGTAHMSMLFGCVFLCHQFGSFLGAWLAGYLYDLFGSYDAMWWLSVALGIFSAIMHWPIAERPVPRLAMAQRA